jgi:hypothetical protein
MKLRNLLEANEPLKRLSEKRLASYKKMRELVKLRKAVEAEVEFYAAEETKSVNTYAELDDTGAPIFLPDGRLRLRDAEAKTAFETEIEALRDTEIDDIFPVSLSEADFLTSSDLPTTNEMIALEHIINFED